MTDIPRLQDNSPLTWAVVAAVKEAMAQPFSVRKIRERFLLPDNATVRAIQDGKMDWLRAYEQGRRD